MNGLLAIEGLTLRVGDSVLVDDLSLTVAAGERVGLIGESGSGKSLTALAATGLLAPAIRAQGSILLDGRQVIGAPDRVLDGLRGKAAAIVFQEPATALDPLMKAGRQVAAPLRRRLARENLPADRATVAREVLALLERVRLPDPQRIAASYPYEMSGGQRQRVAIAMALACRPKLLIADEPTTALDVTTQAEVLKLLDTLVREENMALLFISHDLPVVAQIVERVVVLREGRKVEEGAVDAIFSRPQHPYTQSLMAAARAFDDAFEGAA